MFAVTPFLRVSLAFTFWEKSAAAGSRGKALQPEIVAEGADARRAGLLC